MKHKKAPKPSFWAVPWRTGLLLAAFAFILYTGTLQHGYVLDDDIICGKNDYVNQGIEGIPDIFTHSWYEGFSGEKGRYYRPMMLAAFAVEKEILGDSARSHHWMNVLWYAFAVFLLYLLLRRLFNRSAPLLAIAATLLFAAHPIHTEVVANIKSRDELFSFLCLLGVLLFLMRYVDKQKPYLLILSILSYFLGVLSKEAALAILGLVPLTLYFFTSIKPIRILKISSFYLIVPIIFFIIRGYVTDQSYYSFGILDNALFAAESNAQQVASALMLLGNYLWLLIFPHPLSFTYGYAHFPLVGFSDWRVWLSIIIMIALAVIAVRSFRSKTIYAYSIWFFTITFVITSNLFFLIGITFAERLLFTPSLAFCIVLAFLLYHFLYLKPEKPLPMIIALVVILGFYSFKTFERNSDWQDDYHLFHAGVTTSPGSTRANHYYAKALFDRALNTQDNRTKENLLNESLHYYEQSLTIFPGNIPALNNKGLLLETIGKQKAALRCYRQAAMTDTSFFIASANCGIMYLREQNYDSAVFFLQRAYRHAPDHFSVIFGLGKVYHGMQEYEEAADLYSRALEIDPRSVAVLGKLVELYRDDLQDIPTAIMYDKRIKAIQGNR